MALIRWKTRWFVALTGQIVIERVVVRDRELEAIEWTAPARPFFEKQRVCPQGDSNP